MLLGTQALCREESRELRPGLGALAALGAAEFRSSRFLSEKFASNADREHNRLMAKPRSAVFPRWIVVFLLAINPLLAEEKIEDAPDLAAIFQEQRVQGTFALLDAKTGQLTAHNVARATKRFIPASTFKIPNTVIGLETGAVKGVDEVLPYGGKPQPFPDWEHDLALREAIRISSVPIYQELARRIGLTRMNEWVTRLGYGNATIGNTVDQFWLNGPLEISAVEQTQFLARLAEGKLPIRAETVAAVKEITQIEKTDAYTLHSKTGWCSSADPDIGWWVGWVEREGSVTAFALNIDMPDKGDVAKRVPIGKACLRALGVLPAAQ